MIAESNKVKDKALIFNIQKYSIHDGPGIRSVVFFKGCPLRCFWCSNPESQLKKPEDMWDNTKKAITTVGEYKTYDDIINEVLKDRVFYEESGGGVTFSGGEVLFQAEFATELARRLRDLGIHMACETTGYASTKTFSHFIEQMDLIFIDFKHPDSKQHRLGTGVPNELVIKNIMYAKEHHDQVIVRIPIIPNFNDSLEVAHQFAHKLNDMHIDAIELLPFHQFGENKYKYLNRDYKMKNVPQLHAEDLEDYKQILEAAGITVSI
ncbi:glycyl-radical enzyme activating protein [Aerococcus sanguinicola]|uniref:glycyl-radical enzyme activating protein n=1 Tax=unclassified Aerococcus TaxID=2618060 RepID=UPI0008A64A1B|nr:MULTISPECIES: glycyl-radical enzyme activating protein [unclassified Aerococcus]KAB0645757.1 glycyl-radical enzyme activating protein [Aerococcus sanguinicola]MDK6234331.1 glycyl-radical enzyme activating protein [Aerococcus sp. UMB10185]MDK6856436.1 glycyl-radical enzyme activating protein [Aerococcus sp. UMB7533]OFN01198.1 pyruvate formate lyase-activating protein [Aerococcus sp. HMSC062A02]OHO44340.1 pyruvate formate lyase-activating protein [Aerococcus sp. HMSC035B07]